SASCTLLISLLRSLSSYVPSRVLLSFPTRRSSDLPGPFFFSHRLEGGRDGLDLPAAGRRVRDRIRDRPEIHRRLHPAVAERGDRSEEHTSELQSRENLVCRLLLEKKKKQRTAGCTT